MGREGDRWVARAFSRSVSRLPRETGTVTMVTFLRAGTRGFKRIGNRGADQWSQIWVFWRTAEACP